jgi:hypothetical protein
VEQGCGELFAPGTDTKVIIEYITNWVSQNRTI